MSDNKATAASLTTKNMYFDLLMEHVRIGVIRDPIASYVTKRQQNNACSHSILCLSPSFHVNYLWTP